MRDIIKENCNIHTIILGIVHTNCYIISNKETKEALVIDPADSAQTIEDYLKKENLELKGILLTHGHFDHILAAGELAAHCCADIYANELEKELLADSYLNFGANMGVDYGLEADIWLKDGQTLFLAGFPIKVIYTPGHTAGGTCYYFEQGKILFSGDTLFREAVGRTDLPTSNSKALIESIQNKLMKLEEKTEVYPGHGQSTTIENERKNNPFLDLV